MKHYYLLPYLLTSGSTVLLETPTGSQLVKKKKIPTFIQHVCSLPHSLVPATCPYPKPARSSLYPHNSLPENPFYTTHPSKPGSPKCSLSLTFPNQNPLNTSVLPILATCPVHLVLLNYITRKKIG